MNWQIIIDRVVFGELCSLNYAKPLIIRNPKVEQRQFVNVSSNCGTFKSNSIGIRLNANHCWCELFRSINSCLFGIWMRLNCINNRSLQFHFFGDFFSFKRRVLVCWWDNYLVSTKKSNKTREITWPKQVAMTCSKKLGFPSGGIFVKLLLMSDKPRWTGHVFSNSTQKRAATCRSDIDHSKLHHHNRLQTYPCPLASAAASPTIRG